MVNSLSHITLMLTAAASDIVGSPSLKHSSLLGFQNTNVSWLPPTSLASSQYQLLVSPDDDHGNHGSHLVSWL